MANQELEQPRTAADGRRRSRSVGAKTGNDLGAELRGFAAARPNGWDHDDWEAFVAHLRERGHNVNDQAAIGAMLEKERIAVLLDKVPGMGPQRIRRLAEAFGSVWRIRNAGAEEIAAEANIPRLLADRVEAALR